MQTAQPFKRESNLSSRGLQQKSVFVASRPAPEEDLPECYFHRENRITKFCECSKIGPYAEECTLPLCPTCEEIHLEEHDTRKVKAQISAYTAVRERAMKDLPQLIRRYRQVLAVFTQTRENLLQAIYGQYDQLLQAINTYFQHLIKDVDTLIISEAKLVEYEQRSDKINKGSIKSIIQHYSESYPEVKLPKLNVNFSAVALNNFLRGFCSLEGRQPPQPAKESPENRRASELAPLPTAGNQGRRLELSPKLTLAKPFGGANGEEELHISSPFDRPPPQYVSPIDKLTGETKKHQQETSPVRSPPDPNIASRKSTLDLLDPNAINRKKYEEIRDSFRRGNTLMMGNSTINSSSNAINRSNTGSLEGKDWKKMITTLTNNQSNAASGTALPPSAANPPPLNVGSPPTTGYQSLNSLRKDQLQPITDQHQRSPSFSTHPAQKPKTNPPECGSPTIPVNKQLTHQQINQLIVKREELSKQMQRTRNRSVDIKKGDPGSKSGADIAERFASTKPQEALGNRPLIERKDAPEFVEHPPNSAGRYLSQYSVSSKIIAEQQPGPSAVVSSLINSSTGQQQNEHSTQNSFIRREQQGYVKRYDSNAQPPPANPSTTVSQAIRSGRVKEQAGKVATEPSYEYRYLASKQPPTTNH